MYFYMQRNGLVELDVAVLHVPVSFSQGPDCIRVLLHIYLQNKYLDTYLRASKLGISGICIHPSLLNFLDVKPES